MDSCLTYRDLDFNLIKEIVSERYAAYSDILIVGSYAYSQAKDASDIECLVFTDSNIDLYRGKNYVTKYLEKKIILYEISNNIPKDFLWLRKYNMPKYSMINDVFYDGNKDHIEEWISIKSKMNRSGSPKA